VNPLRSDPAFAQLKEHVIAVSGLAYYADKEDDLAERVAGRLAVLELQGCGAYLALLLDSARGEAELDALIATLTIGETSFFRHGEMFEALRTVVVPDLLNRNRDRRRLHIWSAGCSIGAEPYSVAILLKRDFAAALAGWDVSIVGTDVNRAFLARAREGCYEEWALRNTTEDFRRRNFVRAGSCWRIVPEYREGVSFRYHNLVSQPFPSLWNDLCAFDLILCRNVTIYFAPEIVRRVVVKLHRSLVDGGWLAVGHAEPNTELFAPFRTVNAVGAVLYQKPSAPPSSPAASAALATVPPVPAMPAWTPPVLPALSRAPTPVRVEPPAIAPAADLAEIRALADKGAWEEADGRCRAALAQERLNPGVYFYHALVLEQTGRHHEAERALRQALYLDRRFVLAHYYLGLLMQKQGRLPVAAHSFENVLELLSRAEPGHVFGEGDGISALELDKLTRMHLEALTGA
jgi:chemotaxis protein methyltransferase CheR